MYVVRSKMDFSHGDFRNLPTKYWKGWSVMRYGSANGLSPAGTKPSPALILISCQLDLLKNFIKIQTEIQPYQLRQCIRKCLLQNGRQEK